MAAQIIAFLPRYLRATAEAPTFASAASAPDDLTMDHVDTSPSEILPFEVPPAAPMQRRERFESCKGPTDA